MAIMDKTAQSTKVATQLRRWLYLLALTISLYFLFQLLSVSGLVATDLKWLTVLMMSPWALGLWLVLTFALIRTLRKFRRANKGEAADIHDIAVDLLREYLSEEVTLALKKNKARKEILPTFYDQVLCGFDVSLKYAIGGLPIKARAQVTDIIIHPEVDPAKPKGNWTGTFKFICRVHWLKQKDPKKIVTPYVRDQAVPVRLSFIVSKKQTDFFKKKSVGLAYFWQPTGRVFQNITLTYLISFVTLGCSLMGLATTCAWVLRTFGH